MAIEQTHEFIDFSNATNEGIVEEIKEQLKRQIILFAHVLSVRSINEEIFRLFLSKLTDGGIVNFFNLLKDFIEKKSYTIDQYIETFAQNF